MGIFVHFGDAMMGVMPNCMDYDWEQEKFNHTYSLWGVKTQSEPYHMYLLPIEESEKMNVFEHFYLGEEKKHFMTLCRTIFTQMSYRHSGKTDLQIAESAAYASGQGLDGDFFRYGEASEVV